MRIMSYEKNVINIQCLKAFGVFFIRMRSEKGAFLFIFVYSLFIISILKICKPIDFYNIP